MSPFSRWLSTALALGPTSTPFARQAANETATSVASISSDVTIAGAVDNTLVIQNRVIAPDGWERPTVLAGPNGGSFPGPLITGNSNSNFDINVVNRLNDTSMYMSTSIHWHGFFQRGTNWADGGSEVNQCPISPDHSFRYRFHANGQAGTFWYHSHHHTQYCDGLRGPLVVYDPKDPFAHLYDYDDASTVITLADWYHVPSKQQSAPFQSEATLINGLGRAYNTTQVPKPADLAVVSVKHGKRYRLRLVSISCDPNFVFSIDGHNMTIIEVDGQNHQPLTVDSIQIFAAQRYSVILEANQPKGNYWIRAKPDLLNSSRTLTGADGGGINSAILRYVGAPKEEPQSLSLLNNTLVESDLVPLVSPAAPGPADLDSPDVYALNLGLGFKTPNFTINDVSFNPPSLPVLLQIISGKYSAQSLLPTGSVYTLPPNRTVQISLPMPMNGSSNTPPGGPHPFHLHGHAFSVIRGAGQGNGPANFTHAPRRDVVSTGLAGDNVTIRFVTDNPGPWFLHCHIDWHLEAGFAVVLAEDAPQVKAANPVPQEWDELCPVYTALPSIEQR